MKHYELKGFNAIVKMDGEVVTVEVAGNVVTPKKGEYALKCTDASGNAEDWTPTIGTAYKFTQKMLIENGEGVWIDNSIPVAPAAPVVDADPVKEANKAELKRLKGIMTEAAEKFNVALPEFASGKMNATEFGVLGTTLATAKKTYEDFALQFGGKVKKEKKEKIAKIVKEISQAEKDSVAALDLSHSALEAATEAHIKLIDAHNANEGWGKYGKKGYKAVGIGKGTGNKGGGGERILDYDKAQSIRKEYATMIKGGKTEIEAIKALVDSSELNRTMVLRVINYRQHLLKAEDKDFLKTLPFNKDYFNRFAGEKLPEGCKDQNAWYTKKC